MADWTEKHRPRTLREVRGNDSARDDLEEWAKTWEDHREAAVVYGGPGVGKTSAVQALAADLGWEVVEMNASDDRTADVVEAVAGEAARSGTLTAAGTAGRRLIVLDEADNLHGDADRGGAKAIGRLVSNADQPVVLIANDYYELSHSLRRATREIEFRDVSARSILPVLRDICRKENIEYQEEALERIAEQTDGDLRSAVNDLQALAEDDRQLTVEDVVVGDRDRTTDVFNLLDEIIKEKDAEGALRASYDADESPDDLIGWLDENVPKDFDGAELADAYHALTRADEWLGRVRATQNYSYWRYATDNMTAGVAAARATSKGGWTRYSPPSYWSKLGRSRATREIRDHIAQHVAEEHGVSIATARREIIPFLAALTHHCNPRELTVEMATRYELETDHVAFITGSGEDTNKVAEIVAEARRRRGETVEEETGYFESTLDSTLPTESRDGNGADGDFDDDRTSESETTVAESIESGTDESRDESGEDAQSGLDDFA